MHGLGNDYVYVDGFAQALDGVDAPALARAISDRHRGVGSDGLILITPPAPGIDADVRMEMYNADGSRGEMCGNGIRCVAKYAVERGLVSTAFATANSRGRKPAVPAAGSVTLLDELNMAVGGFLGDTLALNEISDVDLRVQTDRGVLQLTAFTSNGIVRSVRVDMGPPILEPARIPVRCDSPQCVRQRLRAGDQALTMTCVSMGNPHAVFFVENVDAIDLVRLGPMLESHESFPNRTNVHFARVHSAQDVRMRTWERGSGITQACGTGACAVVVAGVLEERLARNVLVHLPGGDLRIEWPEGGSVYMTGPAEEVFSGIWRLNTPKS